MEVTCLNLVLSKDMEEIYIYIPNPMNSMLHKKGGGSRKGSGTFMSNTNCQGIKNSVEQGRVVIT